MNLKKIYGLMLLLFFVIAKVQAQIPGPLGDVLRKIQQQTGAYMTYDYEIHLVRLSDGRVTDSARGRLCNGPDHYRDSNTVFLTARSGDYYCRLNFVSRTAAIYDLKRLSQQLRLGLDKQAPGNYGISEAALNENAVLKVDTSHPGIYRLNYSFREQRVRSLVLDIRREDYALKAAVLETWERNGYDDKDPYVRQYHIYNVLPHAAAQQPDLSGIFRLEQGKVVLEQKYAHYTLNELSR